MVILERNEKQVALHQKVADLDAGRDTSYICGEQGVRVRTRIKIDFV